MARREKCIRKLGRQIIKTTIQNLKTAKEKYMSHLRTSIIDTELLEMILGNIGQIMREKEKIFKERL